MSITIEQAKALKHGDIIQQTRNFINLNQYSIVNGFTMPITTKQEITAQLSKPIKWRVNGKIKLWKRDVTRFSIPIKHGLYDYAYLTNENACLFSLEN